MKRLKIGPATEWVTIDPELKLEVRRLDLEELGAILRPLAGLSAGASDPGEAARPALATLLDRVVGAQEAVLAFIEAAVVDWTVVDDETGDKLEVTRETAKALLRADRSLVASIMNRAVTPMIGRLDALSAEKNASPPSPAGTSAGAETTAQDAAAPAPSVPTH